MVDLDNDRRKEPVALQYGTVHKPGSVGSLFLSASTVDVPEDMQPGSYALDGLTELHTAHALVQNVLSVEDSEGRAMRDEHIGLLGDLVPVPAGCAALDSKGHVGQNRRHRAAPKTKPFQRHCRLLEVHGVRQARPGQLWIGFKQPVVVPCHNDLVSVWKLSEPYIEIIELLDSLTSRRKISRVDEDLGLGHIQPAMKSMRVADTGDDHKSIILCW